MRSTNLLKKQSISQKLAFSLSISLIIVGGAALLLYFFMSTYQAKISLNARSKDFLNDISNTLTILLWDEDVDKIKSICDAHARNDLIGELSVKRYDGLSYYNMIKPDTTVMERNTVSITHRGEYIGQVTLGVSSDYYNVFNRRYFLFYTFSLCLMILTLYIIIKKLLSRYLKTPLTQFVDSVESYTIGNTDLFHEEVEYIEFEPFIKVMREMAVVIKKNVEALRQSEEKYRTLFESFPLGVTITDFSGQILETNLMAEKLINISKEAHEKLSIYDKEWKLLKPDGTVLPADELPGAVSLKQNRVVENSEMGVIKPNGDAVWLNVTAAPIPLKEYGVAITYSDISDRKKMESEMSQQKRLFETMFNTIPDGVVITNEQDEIKLINKSMEVHFGYAPEELLGNTLALLYFDRNKYHQTDIKALGEHFPKKGDLFIVNYQSKDGRKFPGETFGAKLFDANKKCIGNLWIIRDITERKKIESHLQQSQKMEAIGVLAGGIAHDFNNILSAILGYAEMVEDDLTPGSTVFENQHQVIKAALRAKDLVQQILLFSRQTENEMKPVQPHLIALEALKLLKSSIPATIEIRENIKTNCGSIFADSTQLHQIIMNLCTNAYHAMRESGGILEIGLSKIEITPEDFSFDDLHLAPGQYIKLEISDTGVGMDKETMKNIFDPYFTTKPKGEGTGLGLSVVLGIVKSFNGHMKFYSEPGKGTTANIFFPRLETEVDTLDVKREEPVPTGDERVLLVDDEKAILDMTKRMLENLGYNVVGFTDSQQALKAFQADPEPFDLVITDMTMPHMTGLEMVKQLFSSHPRIPVILCTGFSELITKEKAYALGIKGFLAKPILKKELAKTIRKVIDIEQ